MKKFNYIALTLVLLGLSSFDALAQQKVWVSGAARGIMYADEYGMEGDSTTARRQESGHTMVDVGVNIRPNDNIYILGMVRVRNDYGGFWGSGVTFDVRQLTLKGILGGFLKYELGDIDYRMTPYTMYNNVSMANRFAGEITTTPLEQIQYDLFFTDDNTWRQQGGSVNFGLEFSSVLQEAQFDFFTTRVRTTNFTSFDDRLFSGGSIVLLQSDRFNIGGQYANLWDLSGTSDATVFLRNPVMTLTSEYTLPFANSSLSIALETGRSTMRWEGDEEAPELEDFFYDVRLRWKENSAGFSAEVGYREVGPNFRAPGAQTLRINYAGQPRAYGRIGNDQTARVLSLLDLSRDASLYRTQINSSLMSYDPRYDNATPYGLATPNRAGFTAKVGYEDAQKRWKAGVEADLLNDLVGLGTTALTSYNTLYGDVELRIDRMIASIANLDREIVISGGYGMQASARSGENAYETIDLSSAFYNMNLSATLVGDLSLIGEWRNWQTSGSTLVSERNMYTEIIDFTEYDIDYNESIMGIGLKYAFAEGTALRIMYQNFDWNDSQSMEAFDIRTWNIYFTMKF